MRLLVRHFNRTEEYSKRGSALIKKKKVIGSHCTKGFSYFCFCSTCNLKKGKYLKGKTCYNVTKYRELYKVSDVWESFYKMIK